MTDQMEEKQDLVPSPRPDEPTSHAASTPAPEPERGAVSALDVTGTAPLSAPEPGPGSAPKDRRFLRATLRWTAAVLTFAVVGAGTAYGISGVGRTDLPGLATKTD